ncbi:hypothetical protein CJ739_2894 [Mariniflexile rhizosphaerae]|uniref:DUF349 domain-containing protein n=1 Tax=unclassified Mariniflexile TaxID=2643887 RepID=UPI000CBEE45E|nr:DUF349 domain-containing protein [Mariniflexile sp. TRM1-10]AXP81959.1 hypothetical protein CJ739_2894 [Mariniflexile sp. TRM1-10]PLB19183.1 MAG: DUF349 domain containing protein [Flavobacteriaceae bacterium FS1-H7996/R]
MSDINNLPKAEGKEEIKKDASHSDNVLEENKSVETNHSETKDTPSVSEEKTIDKNESASDDIKNSDKQNDEVFNEIEDSNAEDAEDEGNKERHTIEVKAYDTMSLEALTIELERLVKNEKVQAIKSHVDGINSEFKDKFQALLDEKKEEFLNDGGDEIDFYYVSPIQKRYKEAYNNYRKKLNDHYQNLEKNLKQNLADKLEIIEELKGLINVEENINTTYKHFKELQERWRTTGPIPRDKYNNAWNSYHHHVEMFYDFLHLNRDLRDLDFKHNLERKLLIIERAEELAADDNVMRAFRELQELHKMWKEELGPVDKEHREVIWEKFKAATKKINDKRQVYYQQIDKVYEKNLEKKLEIIESINAVTAQGANSHNGWQKKIKEIEDLREQFFNIGKVPREVNESTWAKFKESVRTFNRQKNAFYKDLKKDQYTNLQKKLDLIKIAEDNKDSDDFEVTTALMKKIQSDWKKIGHVPRKDSDKIWKRFKAACNFYFDKLHATRNAANKESLDAFNNKIALLETLKNLKPVADKEKNVESIKEYINKWKDLGRVPNDKRYIEGKFNKAIEDFLTSLKMDRNEVEMIKFENKLDIINASDDNKDLDNERYFIRKKIDEVKSQINQLENNLQFFTNVEDDNPLVKEVHNNIKTHKEALKLWKSKLSKIKELY